MLGRQEPPDDELAYRAVAGEEAFAGEVRHGVLPTPLGEVPHFIWDTPLLAADVVPQCCCPLPLAEMEHGAVRGQRHCGQQHEGPTLAFIGPKYINIYIYILLLSK